jgi:hypothetical protein
MKQRLEHIEALAEELIQEIRSLRQEFGTKEDIPKNIPKILPQLKDLANGGRT